MQLVTLQRRAPVAPGAAQCRLCDAPIAGTFQDHLLVGQPGVAHLEAAICPRCGEAVRRLAELCGPDLSVLVQDHPQSVESLIGGPAARTTLTRAPADQPDAEVQPLGPELERTRQHLAEEAETLARTERSLRAEAAKLETLRRGPGQPAPHS
jgi:hypothetical protein